MKTIFKLLVTTTSLTVCLTAPFGYNASTVKAESKSALIQPFSLIAYEDASFTGQLQTAFTYSSGKLRIFVQNKSTKSINYSVTNSNGYKIWSGRLAGNDSVTGLFLPSDGDLPPGRYKVNLSNDDGSTSAYLLSARDEL
ncbi:hypothetical protein ACI48J_19310 [Paenibacillus chitinolyticus]|uniref:hypothetical protein n=1 Tax=Paenibacillus chitinolyticus TaxID=79263 RepID=UPI00386BC903